MSDTLRDRDPNEDLLDRDHIRAALNECLELDDRQGYLEVMAAYLSASLRALAHEHIKEVEE